MRYCEQCGTKIEYGNTFCQACGEKLPEDTYANLPVDTPTNSPSRVPINDSTAKNTTKRGLKIAIIGVIVTVVILAGAIFVYMNHQKQVALAVEQAQKEEATRQEQETLRKELEEQKEALEKQQQEIAEKEERERIEKEEAEQKLQEEQEELEQWESVQATTSNPMVPGNFVNGSDPTLVVVISNVTSTSFDFIIKDGDYNTIFKKHTAVVTGEYSAVYDGVNYYLVFDFAPLDLQISGFPATEGVYFENRAYMPGG